MKPFLISELNVKSSMLLRNKIKYEIHLRSGIEEAQLEVPFQFFFCLLILKNIQMRKSEYEEKVYNTKKVTS